MNLYVRILRKEKAGKNGSACVFCGIACSRADYCFSSYGRGGKNGGAEYRAASSEDRIAYLSQFGWSVKEDPVEVCEVIIPAEFDDVYEKYNELQKEQGFDLSLYASKRVKRWTYEITNYTGYENTGFIHANILVYDGKVIGGDVCSTELNGFMHGFAKPDNTGE
ncbi:MAG: DUF4830 domain-containing protein [Acutalibacteraceae bacterium]